jgi:toxin ParE1/3/4
MKLRYERGALADLDEIFAYIAQDNREAAARLVARIEQVAARIAETPYVGEQQRNPDSGASPSATI